MKTFREGRGEERRGEAISHPLDDLIPVFGKLPINLHYGMPRNRDSDVEPRSDRIKSTHCVRGERERERFCDTNDRSREARREKESRRRERERVPSGRQRADLSSTTKRGELDRNVETKRAEQRLSRARLRHKAEIQSRMRFRREAEESRKNAPLLLALSFSLATPLPFLFPTRVFFLSFSPSPLALPTPVFARTFSSPT